MSSARAKLDGRALSGNRFPLTAESFASSVNPTLEHRHRDPIFRTRRDAELTKAIYGQPAGAGGPLVGQDPVRSAHEVKVWRRWPDVRRAIPVHGLRPS